MFSLERKARAQAEEIFSDPLISASDLRRLKYRLSKGLFDGGSWDSGIFGILVGKRTLDRERLNTKLQRYLYPENKHLTSYCAEIYQGGRFAKARAKILIQWIEEALERRKQSEGKRRKQSIKDLNAEITAMQESFVKESISR